MPDKLTIDHVNELVATMIANGVETLELTGRDYAVRLVRAPGSGAATSGFPEPVLEHALSPASGPFYPRGGDDGFTDLERGAHVRAGEPIGYIALGSVRLLCVAPATGQLRTALPPTGTPVMANESVVTVEIRQ